MTLPYLDLVRYTGIGYVIGQFCFGCDVLKGAPQAIEPQSLLL